MSIRYQIAKRLVKLTGMKKLLDTAYMKTAGVLMAHFYYGGDKMLSACAKPFAAAYEKAGTKYTMHIEPGMCHGYPMPTFFPEGKKAYEEIVDLLHQN